MPRSPKVATPEDARFVFVGTVQKLRAATLEDVPIDDRTVIVRVDEIVHAPEALTHYTGHDLTVHVGGRKRVQVGQQATFYTNPWLFGDSVAVESIDHDEVRRTASQAVREAGDPSRRLAQRDLQARVADAKLVVSGRVTSVRVPESAAAAADARGLRGAKAGPARTRISEHEPDWRVADIQVDEVYKGSAPTGSVSVRFPSSTDVAWFDAPKFHPGQEGVFMLHPAAAPRAGRARGALARDMGEYVAPRSADFQPFSDPISMSNVLESLAEGSGQRGSEEDASKMPRRAKARRSPARTKRSTKRASRGSKRRR